MSHHIHFVPQLLPLERPLKPDKKRRIRKRGVGGVSYTDDIDEAEEVGEAFTPPPIASRTAAGPVQPREDPGQPVGATLGRATMSTLLRAQEDS